MNNKETTKSATENNSLMRKTKAQLVEIILRKDSIERNLRADIKGTEETLKTASDNLNSMRNSYIVIKNDYTNLCDEKVSIECELNNKIKKQEILIGFLTIIFFISIAFNCILFIS